MVGGVVGIGVVIVVVIVEEVVVMMVLVVLVVGVVGDECVMLDIGDGMCSSFQDDDTPPLEPAKHAPLQIAVSKAMSQTSALYSKALLEGIDAGGICIYANIYIYIYTHACIYICVYTHSHMYKYIHMYIC